MCLTILLANHYNQNGKKKKNRQIFAYKKLMEGVNIFIRFIFIRLKIVKQIRQAVVGLLSPNQLFLEYFWFFRPYSWISLEINCIKQYSSFNWDLQLSQTWTNDSWELLPFMETIVFYYLFSILCNRPLQLFPKTTETVRTIQTNCSVIIMVFNLKNVSNDPAYKTTWLT